MPTYKVQVQIKYDCLVKVRADHILEAVPKGLRDVIKNHGGYDEPTVTEVYAYNVDDPKDEYNVVF